MDEKINERKTEDIFKKNLLLIALVVIIGVMPLLIIKSLAELTVKLRNLYRR